MEVVIDKIVGSSSLSSNRMTVHYKTCACAFVCHGFFSIVLPKEQRRYDLRICDDCREISALAFSNNGQHLVIGEMGPNARFFIVTFSERYDRILTKTEMRTKENGFSCVAMNSDTGRVITVGNDTQPFFLLWDTTQPRPTCVGCYHLPVCPTNLQMSIDGSFAFVCGPKMLKFIETGIQPQSSPVVLKSRNGNIGQFKDANFVAVAISVESPFSAYALTHDGILCVFDTASIPFGAKRRGQSSIVTVPIRLNCGETSSLVMDKKIILCGTASGAVLAIKKERGQHKVFGQFSSEGKAVMGIGIAERMTAAAYDDGCLMFWQRRINSPPVLTLAGHRGPVCGLFAQDDLVLSCGSDGTVRSWKLQKNQELIGKSSQEQICVRTIAKKTSDYLTKLTGVRCVAAQGKLVFAGDNSGNLHVMKVEKLEEIKKIIENFPGVMCVCAHQTEPYVATGGGDGSVRLYTVNGQNLSLTSTIKCHSSPVTAILFVEKGLISTSSDGIRFCRVDTGQIYASYETEEPLLALATIPSGKMVVSGGYDGYLYMFRVIDGSLFRKHKLGQSSYPLAVAIDKAGLFVAAAMSDGIVRVLDLFSGDTIFSFNSLSGIITSIWFHENDLLLASYSGSIMRWQTPQMIHKAIAEKENKGPEILSLLLPQTKPEPSGDGSSRVQGSLMKGMKPQADWLFKEIGDGDMQPIADKPLAQEGNEEEDEVEQAGFDAPRPSVEGAYETKVDDVVRTSFMKRKREMEESRSIGKDKSSSSIVEELTVPPARQHRTSSSGRPKPKPAPKIEPIPIEPDDIDPFTINDKTASGGIVKYSKADEMRAAAEQLTSSFENAMKMLAAKPTCPEEIAAHGVLQNAVDSIKTELVSKSTTIVRQQLKDYAQKLLFAIEQLE